MKKQYLISLLGLAAISIPFGNSLFNSPSFAPSSSSTEEDSSKTTNYDTSENNLNQEEILTEDEYFNYSIEQVSTGENHSAAVVNDGTTDHLYTWGANDKGQLGLGDGYSKTEYNTPQEVIFYNGNQEITGDITDISMGTSYSAAVMDNNLYTWGANDFGQLGLGKKGNKLKNTPQLVTGLNNTEDTIEQISMGTNHSAAVVNDGITDHLYTWGDNSDDQLGLGDDFIELPYNTPQEVIFYDGKQEITGDITDISMGTSYSAAVMDNKLYTWGINDKGQLGLGGWKKDSKNTPQPVTVLNNIEGTIEQISMGGNHSAAVVNDGTTDELYTWGANESGRLGLGDDFTEPSYNTPQPVTGLNNKGTIEQISMGTSYSAAVINNGGTTDELYTWGANESGRLGLGDDFTEPSYNTPQPVTGLNNEDNIEQISMGGSSSNVILSDENSTIDSLSAWGDNSSGKLGLGEDFTDNSYNTPQKVWETPYISNISSKFKITGKYSNEVKISYSFKTNLNVKKVIIGIKPEESRDYIEKESEPKLNLAEEYEGSVTFSELTPGTTYTYIIELNFLTIEGNFETITLADECAFYNPIEPVSPTIKEDGITSSEINEDPTSMKIDFNLNLGNDENNDSWILKEIILIDNDFDNDVKGHETSERTYTEDSNEEDSKFTINKNGNGSILVKDLRPSTEYNFDISFKLTSLEPIDETTLNGNITFKTPDAPIISSSIEQTRDAYDITLTEASIDYEVNIGTDKFGDPLKDSTGQAVKVQRVYWKSGSDVLADSNCSKGTLTTDKLDSGETYNNTYIYAEFTEGPRTESVNIHEFETFSYIEPTMEISNYSTTSTSMTFDYNATLGFDLDDKPYNLKKIEIRDSNNILYKNISFKDEPDSSGNYKSKSSITINGLDSNTSYSGWKMYSTFENSSEDEKDDLEPIETDINRFETSLFSRNMIFIISAILLSIIFLLILIFLLWKIIKKSRTKNERVTESKGRNPNYWS